MVGEGEKKCKDLKPPETLLGVRPFAFKHRKHGSLSPDFVFYPYLLFLPAFATFVGLHFSIILFKATQWNLKKKKFLKIFLC